MHSKRFSPLFSVAALLPLSVAVLLSSGHASAGPASTEPVLVADINTYSEDGFRFGSVLGTIDGVSYVTLIDEEHGEELWRTDGTEAGTQLVKDIWPGSHSSYIKNSIVVDDEMYFRARTLEYGEELWKTDGTEAGTQLVKDINPGPGHSYANSFIRLGDELIFGATDGEQGTELWKTDGTEAGTQLVKDINPGEGASFASGLTLVGNEVLFSAMDDNGIELWKTDGTTAGTQMVKDINPFGSSGPDYLLEFEGLKHDDFLFSSSVLICSSFHPQRAGLNNHFSCSFSFSVAIIVEPLFYLHQQHLHSQQSFSFGAFRYCKRRHQSFGGPVE